MLYSDMPVSTIKTECQLSRFKHNFLTIVLKSIIPHFQKNISGAKYNNDLANMLNVLMCNQLLTCILQLLSTWYEPSKASLSSIFCKNLSLALNNSRFMQEAGEPTIISSFPWSRFRKSNKIFLNITHKKRDISCLKVKSCTSITFCDTSITSVIDTSITSVIDVMHDEQSYLKLCYSDPSHKFLLCFEGADCACYS